MQKPEMKNLESSVRGCWLGKNIGGTLGAPFEGSREIRDVKFYVQKDLNGNPEPNDDLDLQLVWLTLAEYYGVYRLTPRLLGEYWIDNIIGPWNEYAVCRWNCKSGFYPPLSGSVDNEHWKWSNGAWIRSEIWACLFPGDPDKAIEFAYLDASCDHVGEGIYAEMFTAALESAAFVEKNLRKLIDIGLSKIPDDSRIRKSIDFVCKCFDDGEDWKTARGKVVEFNIDLGWFQAPSNVAFAVIGLLYGRGDFGKTICIATDCGDDTDCTAATAGAIMGILLGAENIPTEWIEPIGDGILTKAIDHFGLPVPAPKTITELTERVLTLGKFIREEYPHEIADALTSRIVAEKIWKKSPYELQFDISYATIGMEYVNGPWIEPGEKCSVRLWIHSPVPSMPEFRFLWRLPEGWKSSSPEVRCSSGAFCRSVVETEIVPPENIPYSMSYLPLEIRADGRDYPVTLNVPFRRKGSCVYPKHNGNESDSSLEYRNMICQRLEKTGK